MKNSKKTWAIMMSILIGIISCKKEKMTENFGAPPSTNLISAISAAKKSLLDSAAQSWIGCQPEQTAINDPQQMGAPQVEINGNYSCVVTPYQVAPGYNEVMIFSPSDILDVGRWLSGSAAQTGSYQPVPVSASLYAPQTISISMQTQQGASASTTIQNPSHSAYVNAHNELIGNVLENATPAYVSYEIESIHEYNQAISHIGASYGGWGANIAGSYDFSNSSTRSRFLIKFIQKYYTIDLDIPALPSEWFTDSIPDYEQLSQYCPSYISSITYGRAVYLTIESNASKETTQAALNASFSGWGNDFTFDWSQGSMSNSEISNIKAFVVGGSSNFLSLDNMGDFSAIINSGAQFSSNSPGVPIAFTQRRLSDNSIVNFVTLSEYNVQECTLIGVPYTINVNENTIHTFCPINTHGDDEFAGFGPAISGSIKLIRRNADTELWAVVGASFNETIPDENPNDTQAAINPDDESLYIWLYTAPVDRQILSIDEVSDAYFSMTDLDMDPDPYSISSGFIDQLILNGDTDGDDLGCQGDLDAYLQVTFKDINITLTP